jgi:hypothetical protein
MKRDLSKRFTETLHAQSKFVWVVQTHGESGTVIAAIEMLYDPKKSETQNFL